MRRRGRGRCRGCRIETVLIITIEPPPPWRIAGITACVIFSVPPRLMRIASWICRSVASDSGTSWPPVAALLTSTSMRPNSSSVRSTRLRHWSASVTLVGTQSARRPSAWTSAATASSFEGVRAASTMSAPSRAQTSEMSRPMPGPMPETTTVLPSSITAPASPRRGPVSAPGNVHTKNEPQFTSSDCPVIALDRSEAKKTTASAISAEVAMRLRAASAARSSWTV